MSATSRYTAGLLVFALAFTPALAGCGKSSTVATSTSSATSATSSASSTTSSAAPVTSSVASAGPNPTIDDYIKANNIQETVIHHADPGPTIDLPVPQGWTKIPESDSAPYGGITFSGAASPADPPTIVAILAKLTGNLDPAKIIAAAPGEVKNLPQYTGDGGEPGDLGGFSGYQISGTYAKNGVQRSIAQKTVVIPGADGLYVLQLNADGPQAEQGPLFDAASVIDQQTTIKP